MKFCYSHYAGDVLVRRTGETPQQKEGEEEGDFRKRVKREDATMSRIECSHCTQHLTRQNESFCSGL